MRSVVQLTPAADESVVAAGPDEEVAAVDLAAGPYTARFLPTVGMAGCSLTHDGDELVAFGGGVAALRAGEPAGIPLLYPWANRLSRFTYQAAGRWVDLDRSRLHLVDGLPIHGTMLAAAWQVEAVLADTTRALLQARYQFATQPDQLASFPFPHEIVVFVELGDLGLRVTTEVVNTGPGDLPVSFGWHPYLVLPGVPRRNLAVVLPDREHLEVDGRGIPTGATKHEAATRVVLGEGSREVTFDDGYRLPADGPRWAALEETEPAGGSRRRVVVELVDGYSHLQVYAPSNQAFAALEPMTAPTDALVSGEHRVVPPGERARATFVVRVEQVGPPADDEGGSHG